MHATYDTSGLTDLRSRPSARPTQGSAGVTGARSAVDLTGTCSCGQELDPRHARCTRCGR